MTTRPSAERRRFGPTESAVSRSGVMNRLGFRLSSLLAVALLPLGLIGLFQADAWDNAARSQAADALTGESLRAASPTVGLIREAQGAGAVMAQRVPSLLGDEAACDAAMTALTDASPQYAVAAFVPLDGRMTCGSGGAEFDYADTPLFQQMTAENFPAKAYVQAVGPVSGVSIVLVASPVAGPDGRPVGYVGLALPHAALSRAVEPTSGSFAAGPDPDIETETEPHPHVDFVTFNADGTILTSSRGLGREEEILPSGIDLAVLVNGGSAAFEGKTVTGENRLYAVVPLVPGALYALGTAPARVTLALGGTIAANPFLFTMAMWAGSLLVAWFAAERLVTRYIRQLSRAIGAFADGSRMVGPLDTARAPAEIRDVGQAFLRMTDTILHDEAELEDTVHQKEVLLREVHHRVKNNLQLIASIMNMQMRLARSPETKALMRGLQDRVMSLATVHKELYQTSGLADVRADELLGDITRQIVSMASGPGKRFEVATDFAALRLTPDQAVPVSLLLTEALTNAIKYAEPPVGETMPHLTLSLRTEPGLVTDAAGSGLRVYLAVENSLRAGTPLAADQADGDASSLGTGLGAQLIKAFATQLGGTVTTRRDDASFVVELAFSLAPLAGGEARSEPLRSMSHEAPRTATETLAERPPGPFPASATTA